MQIASLKRLLQDHFTDGLVIIVGSGLSCAEGIPGMSALGDYLSSEMPKLISSSDQSLWKDIDKAIHTQGLEAALLAHQASTDIEEKIVCCTVDLIKNAEKRTITDVFSGNRTLRLTKLLKSILTPNNGLPIITTNYDRLVEIAAEEAGIGADTLFFGSFAGKLDSKLSAMSFCRGADINARKVIQWEFHRRALVYKPHGSLNWYERYGKPVAHEGDLNLQRLVITPGVNKFRSGYESPFDAHREAANRAIDKAKRFLIVGYGFNDDHLETHLHPRIQGGVPTVLLTHSLSENAKKLVKSNEHVLALSSGAHPNKKSTILNTQNTQTEYANMEIWDLGNFAEQVLN